MACPRTHLIYPASEQEQDETVGIRQSSITVRVHRIDLEDPNCIQNAEAVAGLILGAAVTCGLIAAIDLTALASRSGQKHIDDLGGYVSAMLIFGKRVASHGSEDMPVWGAKFRKVDPLESIQAK